MGLTTVSLLVENNWLSRVKGFVKAFKKWENSQLPPLHFSTMIYNYFCLIIHWCVIFKDCDIGYIYGFTVPGVREMRLLKGKTFVKTQIHTCCMLWQNIVVVQGSSYTSSQTALKMKRQINWLSIFLNYFAVMHSFLRSTLCRMEYGLQRKENVGYKEGRTTLTAEFVNPVRKIQPWKGLQEVTCWLTVWFSKCLCNPC